MLQTVPAEPGETYGFRIRIRAVDDATSARVTAQLRFLPSDELKQFTHSGHSLTDFEPLSVTATAPEGTTQARVYIYIMIGHTEHVRALIDDAELIAGAEPLPGEPAPPPDPIPPVYDTLKPLYLDTALVSDAAPRVSIVAPASGVHDAAARTIQAAIRDITRCKVPIISESDPAAAVPITGNLIMLGNRSTNPAISRLYDLHYTLLDLKYPGGKRVGRAHAA